MEILINRVNYSAERNKKIFSILFPIVMKDAILQSDENISFTIDLFSSLLENFGTRIEGNS